MRNFGLAFHICSCQYLTDRFAAAAIRQKARTTMMTPAPRDLGLSHCRSTSLAWYASGREASETRSLLSVKMSVQSARKRRNNVWKNQGLGYSLVVWITMKINVRLNCLWRYAGRPILQLAGRLTSFRPVVEGLRSPVPVQSYRPDRSPEPLKVCV